MEDNLRKTDWAEQRPKLRACLAAGVFALGSPMWLGGGGLGSLQLLDLFGCALPVLAVAAANLWVVLHRSNVESLFSQLCYATGEAMPSAVLALAKEHGYDAAELLAKTLARILEPRGEFRCPSSRHGGGPTRPAPNSVRYYDHT